MDQCWSYSARKAIWDKTPSLLKFSQWAKSNIGPKLFVSNLFMMCPSAISSPNSRSSTAREPILMVKSSFGFLHVLISHS